MTYQDELINNLVNALENALMAHFKHPCIISAQNVAKAKHELTAFIKGCKKNAS